LPELKESGDNHIIAVGLLFAKQSEQNVIRENGVYVTPQYTPPTISRDSEQKK
jgi:hypothetical protein